ncbi:hypothetical protein [Cryobacterium ruanii]|uniref:Uncharacterized protein n=1 Tax=Cryobacterium ruanii TaxID=1259197 RepID=A0A4R9AMD0_9MICO|nr:hypothetical protein [Cryobacterium ruanii]TFD65298.1 hypothetical protein E3T47_10730 [Cryobacterium ruanii]
MRSIPSSMHLRQQLAQTFQSVRLAPLPGQAIGEDVAGLGPHDAAVLFGFRRRSAGFGQLVAAIQRRGSRSC